MKRLPLKIAVLAVAAIGYIAAPFFTAWSIREAARNGDSAYLARAIDWPSVRETLKPTLSQIALDLPDPNQQPVTNPGLWQRFKAYWGQSAVNSAIDGYLTPEGLPQLFAMRKTYRDYTGATDELASLPVFERIKRFWARVKRAEFTSFTTFEVDMADKHEPNRIYLGKLELTSSGWMLKELRIKMLTTANSEPMQLMGSAPAPRGRGWSTGFITPAEAAPARLGFWDRAKAAAR